MTPDAQQSVASASPRTSWRTPFVILICGCLIGMITFGPRSVFGFFLTPMTAANGWGRDVFALALAIEMLLWGAGQPFCGALADRFGAVWVLIGGVLLYIAGIIWMAYAASPLELHLSAGVLIGFGLAGCSFTLVIGAFGKLMPERWRSLAFGAGTAAGSFGQFIFSPLAVALIDNFGWRNALLIFAAMLLVCLPLAFALTAPEGSQASQRTAPRQTLRNALSEAFGHPSYLLLVLGYFTCGFQLFFITVHLPSYLVDRGLPAATGGWAIAIVGLFNIVGAVAAGWLANVVPKRYILSTIYFMRALASAFLVAFYGAILFGGATAHGVTLESLSVSGPGHDVTALAEHFRWIFSAAVACRALSCSFLAAMEERPLRAAVTPDAEDAVPVPAE